MTWHHIIKHHQAVNNLTSSRAPNEQIHNNMKEFSVIIVFLSMLSLGAMYKIAFPEDDPVADKESKDVSKIQFV